MSGCPKVRRLQEVNDLLYAALQEVEWVQDELEGGKYCPSCDTYEIFGHDTDCKLRQALDAARP